MRQNDHPNHNRTYPHSPNINFPANYQQEYPPQYPHYPNQQPQFYNSYQNYQSPYQYHQYPPYPPYYPYHPQQMQPPNQPQRRVHNEFKPHDPRLINQSPTIKTQKNKKDFINKKPIYQQCREDREWESSDEEDEDDEEMYRKTKIIKKHKDPILDTPDEIKKWIEARKKNYPRLIENSDNNKKSSQRQLEKQMSILQKKIRKKIMLVSSDPKNLLKKMKNMDILKRILIGGKVKSTAATAKIQEKAKEREIIRQITKDLKKQQNKASIEEESNHQEEDEIPMEKPIPKQPTSPNIQQNLGNEQLKAVEQSPQKNRNPSRNIRNPNLEPDDMIKHLQSKQQEDNQYFSKILDYRTNSLNYKYAAKTLETNFVLQDIFTESSYLLQSIRYIVKNDFFTKQ